MAIQKRIKHGSISERALVRVPGMKHLKIDSDIADADFKVLRTSEVQAGSFEALPESGDQAPQNNSEDPSLIDEMFGPTPDQKTVRQKSVLDKKLAPIDKPKTVIKEIEGQQVEVHVEPGVNPDTHLYATKYRKAKAGTEELKARKLELEVAELENRLLDKEQVKQRIQKLVSVTRENLLNIPSKCAPDLIAITNLVEMETRLYKEINLALENLSKVKVAFD